MLELALVLCSTGSLEEWQRWFATFEQFSASLSVVTNDDYACHLGSLIGDFQSLEYALRAFLQQRSNAQPSGLQDGEDVYALSLGDEVAESEFTNFDSLRELIKKYNAALPKESIVVVASLVEIRDALAHGRVSAAAHNVNTIRLLKFSKPKNGLVKITFNAQLSEQWFSEQRRRVRDALMEVGSKSGSQVIGPVT